MTRDPRVGDPVSLALLAAVAATGSIGAAARRQGLSQPAASARLRELENAIGAALLDRTPTGSRPTSTGALIIEWAQPLLLAADTFHAALDTLQPRPTRGDTVRIAASTTIAEYLLPRWVATLRHEHPAARPVLDARNSAHVLARLRAGRADLGFTEGTPVPETMPHRVVARDELVLVVHPDHPWSQRATITPRELAATPLITREAGSGSRAVLEHALRAAAAPPIAPAAMEVPTATAVKNAVAAGLGVGVLSVLAVTAELAHRALVAVPLPELDLTRELHAVWPPDRPRSPTSEALIDIAARS